MQTLFICYNINMTYVNTPRAERGDLQHDINSRAVRGFKNRLWKFRTGKTLSISCWDKNINRRDCYFLSVFEFRDKDSFLLIIKL